MRSPPATGTTTSINVLGAILLIVASLSFSRGVQRMFEQAWDLKPLSVRNSMNDLIWLGAVVVYLGLSWWIHHLINIGRIEVAANPRGDAVDGRTARVERSHPECGENSVARTAAVLPWPERSWTPRC